MWYLCYSIEICCCNSQISLYNVVNVALTVYIQRAHLYPPHPPIQLLMTVRLRRVSGSMSRATCLNKAPCHGVNNMKFQDDFGYPLQGYPKLVSAMPHSVLGYFILLPRARPSVKRTSSTFHRNPSYRAVAICDK